MLPFYTTLENNGHGSNKSEEARLNPMTYDTESFKKSTPSKRCKKKQSTIKKNSVS